MFAVYVFAGVLVEGIAAVTLATVLLRSARLLRDVVNAHHLHDLGKLLLRVLDVLGLHLALPVPADLVRQHAGRSDLLPDADTGALGAVCSSLNLVVNWMVPFLVLLPRARKA